MSRPAGDNFAPLKRKEKKIESVLMEERGREEKEKRGVGEEREWRSIVKPP